MQYERPLTVNLQALSGFQSGRGLPQSKMLAHLREGLSPTRQRLGLRQSSAAFPLAAANAMNNDRPSLRFMGRGD